VSAPLTRLAAAEAKSAAARARLDRDVSELQARLDPKLVARSAVAQGQALLDDVRTDQRHQAVAAAAATVIAAWLFRRPLRRLFRPKHRVYATPRTSSNESTDR